MAEKDSDLRAGSISNETRAQAELEKFQAVADYLPHLAWSCLPSGHCDYLSRRWEEYTGVPASDHYGRRWLSAIHVDDRAAAGAAWEAFVNGLTDYNLDYRLRRQDGQFLWFKARGVLLRGNDGRPLRVFGTTTDIHAQKLAEERIREAEERATFVRNASGVGFWYCDLPFDTLEWDPVVKEHFHLPPDARVTIETFYDRIHPDDRAATRRAIEQSIKDRSGYDVHYRTVHPETQTQKWIRAIGRTFYSSDGTPQRFDGVTLDVSQQRHAEQRQRFMADLAAATQPLTEPDQVTAAAARLLADHLGVDRCAYAAIEDQAIYVITGDYVRGVPSIVGRWPLTAFGVEHCRLMLNNEPFVVHDVQSDERIEPQDRTAYAATTIAAVVCIPLHKDGRLTAAMAVHQSVPRQWTDEEVDLIRNVVAHCWEALERTRATRLLRENEEQLRIIMDSVPALIAFVDASQTYRFVNRRYEEWFGKPRGEFEGRHLRDVVGEAAYETLRPYVERGLAGEQFEFEAYAPYPTGSRYIHAALVPRFDGGRVIGYLSLITDVTDRITAQEQLRVSEQRFREMADTAPVALWLTNPNGYCTFLSREWYEFTGQTENEALGLGWTTATHPDDGERAAREFVAANTTQGNFRTEYRLRRHDGSYRWAIDTGRPRFSADGNFLGMVGAVVDIEDRKQAETALRDADKKKDDFLALLAHELRNPLAPLRNGLQVMRLAGSHGEAVEQVRGMMERQLGHMVRLIDDLLDVSRISRNKMELRRDRILLSDVIASAIETARPAIDAAGHEFVVALPPAPIHMDADLTRLAQVVSNLLANAAKYTKNGGKIFSAASLSPPYTRACMPQAIRLMR
jgi:PAS domain S-box-containing protein